MNLRPYQEKAITELRKSFIEGNKKIILTLATGAGKSIIARNIVDMAAAKGNGVLYLAHRTLLVKQMIDTLSGLDNVVVETVQSSKNRHHDDVSVVIIDEMHYGVNSPMQDVILSKYPNASVIGMSATPIMHNGNRIEGWDETIDIVQLKDLIEMGYASPVKVLSPASIDRSSFKTTAGDYNSKDVSAEVTKSAIVGDVVGKYMEYGEDRRAIFYCINIDHAELLASELILQGVNAATYHSKMSNKDEVFNDFKSGELSVLCSVESLTTGVDLPDIYCLVLATPTKSIIKAVQIYGRGTRLDPKNKDKDCLILDCANVIDDTVHPLERLAFNKIGDKKSIDCNQCDGDMKVTKRTMSEIDDDTGIYTVTSILSCDKCGVKDTIVEDKVYEFNFCEECDTIIEKGTSTSETEVDENNATIFLVCPHCQYKKEYRSVPLIDVGLEERKFVVVMEGCDTWEDIHSELRKAKNKYGAVYHYKWAERVRDGFIAEGFTIEEVKSSISFYIKNKWAIGGILSAMIKRRDNTSKV